PPVPHSPTRSFPPAAAPTAPPSPSPGQRPGSRPPRPPNPEKAPKPHPPETSTKRPLLHPKGSTEKNGGWSKSAKGRRRETPGNSRNRTSSLKGCSKITLPQRRRTAALHTARAGQLIR